MKKGTPIGRVRGLGSSHSGAHSWVFDRLLALGNMFVALWFVASLLMLPNLGYVTVIEWIARPVPATAMALLVLTSFWHAAIGMQVMIEDYVHDQANRLASLLAMKLLAFAGAAFGLFCIFRLALGGA